MSHVGLEIRNFLGWSNPRKFRRMLFREKLTNIWLVGTSFGGIHNIAQPAGAKAAAAAAAEADQDGASKLPEIIIPTSNVGHAVQSLSRENVIDHWGHYVHDEHRGAGVFRSLLEHAAQKLKERKDVVGIRLYVEKQNTVAQETYRRLGFSEPGYSVMEMNIR